MDMPRMDMPAPNSSDFFKHGSIFDRARDFPVRSFPNSSFFNKSSPAREASPGRQVPVHTDSASSTVPPSQQQPQQQQQSQTRGSSVPRQTPSPPTAAQQQQQYQQEQAKRYQQYQQEQQQPAHDQTDSQPKKPTPPPPTANDPISKIQNIQRDVLQIFDQVEKFQGTKEGKKNKTYMYLDEMLTQNLLKLDSIDAEDQPQIKSARREAIKSINHCIAVLEAKAEAAGADAASEPSSNNGEHQQVPNGTTDRTGSGASLSHSSSNSSSQQQKQSSDQTQ